MKRVVRPKSRILPDESLVPPEYVVTPPTRFTHRLSRAQPFYFDRTRDASPRGELAKGTRVVVESREGDWCRVVDERGLRVETAADGLEPL
jgi:hypothetical protein